MPAAAANAVRLALRCQTDGEAETLRRAASVDKGRSAPQTDRRWSGPDASLHRLINGCPIDHDDRAGSRVVTKH
jgi:hypothetical protein